MTERAKNSAGPASAGSADEAAARRGTDEERPTVVVRDRRRFRASGTDAGHDQVADARQAGGSIEGEDLVEVPDPEAEAVQRTGVATEVAHELDSGSGDGEQAGAHGPLGAELGALRVEVDERTKDLQRLSAEYANYRKRVDRDRGVVAEQATGTVISALLPVLDDLDRAREHGDLVGPFASVSEQLNAALAKFGLTAFGEKGDAFDPTRHEAVAHQTSAEVIEPTCVDVLRRGYLLGERLLRPALVAVADPE